MKCKNKNCSVEADFKYMEDGVQHYKCPRCKNIFAVPRRKKKFIGTVKAGMTRCKTSIELTQKSGKK